MSHEIIEDRADWLIDAVACSTQNRMFLRGEPEYDDVAGQAIMLNGKAAMEHVERHYRIRISELQAQLAQRDAALKAGDELADTAICWYENACTESALLEATAAYRKARGQDATAKG